MFCPGYLFVYLKPVTALAGDRARGFSFLFHLPMTTLAAEMGNFFEWDKSLRHTFVDCRLVVA